MKGNGAIEFGAHARIRTGDLFLTKEMLVDQFLDGAPLRSNAEAIANSRCLAALPRKSSRHRWFRGFDSLRVDPRSHNTNPAELLEGTGFVWT